MPASTGASSRVIGDISIYPIGEGTSLGEYVKAAFNSMKEVRGLRLAPTAMSTVVEADRLDTILEAVKKAHTTMLEMGARRIAIHLRIDHRLDKLESIEYKVGRLEGGL